MTPIKLYKFIKENNIKWHYTCEGDDVIMFVNNIYIDEFNNLIGSGISDEAGLNCIMKDAYICFYMKDICEYFGIELKEVFEHSYEK